MTKARKNRERWELRRKALLHQRTIDRLRLEIAGFEGRKAARLAALPVHLATLNEIEMERAREGRPHADALLMATVGLLR